MRAKISVLLACFGLLILGGLIYWANPPLLAETISKADLKYLILAFGVSNCAVLARVMKWKVLLPSAIGTISFRALFPVQTFGVAISNLTPGKIGEPIKAVILKLYKRKAVSETLPSIVWERLIDLVILIMLGVIGIQFVTGALDSFYPVILSIGISVIIIVLLLLILHNKPFGTQVFSLLRKFPILSKKIDERFLITFYKYKISKKQRLSSFFFTSVTWCSEGLVLYFILLSLGTRISPLVPIGIFAVSTLIGIASSLPGGLGSTEGVITLFLGGMAIETTTAVAASLLSRALTFGYILVLGFISFLYLGRKVNLKNFHAI
jgi:uncharacterized protein (TIRG00374 family)